MSNLERDPGEVLVADSPPVAAGGVSILQPREVPLGGPRAMTVRRTLPQRGRSLIGAWCFVDHYGPDDVSSGTGMLVPPHPHTGLQTVSWLFAGEVEHRDSVGTVATVRPGELNLMTAGRGIQHSEVSTPSTTTLHGAQLWVALPEATRSGSPRFDHYVPDAVLHGSATLRVFLGSLEGQVSPVPTFSPLVGAQVDLPAGAAVDLRVDPDFELGVLVDLGSVAVNGQPAVRGELASIDPGASTLRLESAEGARLLLIGGAPLGEQILMWWNFIGRSHEEILEYRADWHSAVIAGGDASGRFGSLAFEGGALPAPALPTVRLKPRR